MAEKRIVVPEGMIEAAVQATCRFPIAMDLHDKITPAILEAALRWLSDYSHTLLNDEQLREIYEEWNAIPDKNKFHFYRWLLGAYLQRMFLGPTIPLRIADLQVTDLDQGWDSPINRRILEAYRRGLAER